MTVDTGECRDRMRVRDLMALCPGWTGPCNDTGGTLTHPNGEHQVALDEFGNWELKRFTDGDLPDDRYKGGFVAVGRFETIDEGDTVDGLREVLERL